MADVIRVTDQKIKRVFLKELTKAEIDRIVDVKKGPNAGTQVQIFKDRTHRVSLEMEDGTWYQAGSTRIFDNYPREWQARIDDEYITINNGARVSFKATPGGDFNASIKLKSFDLIENGPKNPNPYIFNPTGGAPGGKGGGGEAPKFNPQGAINGNAFNASMILCGDNDEDPKAFGYAMEILKINGELKEDHKNGPAIGMAILSACKQTMDITKVKASADRKLKGLISDIDVRKTKEAEKPEPKPKPGAEPGPDEEFNESDAPF